MPVLSQGNKTNDFRIVWGHGGYTHVLADRLTLREARAKARGWAVYNKCRAKVEGFDLDTQEWVLFAEF